MTHTTKVDLKAIKSKLRRQGRRFTKFTFPPQLDHRSWDEEYERRIIENNQQHLIT